MTHNGETRGQHISTLGTALVGFTTVSHGGLTVEKRIMPKSNCDANEYAGVVLCPGGHFAGDRKFNSVYHDSMLSFRRRYGVVPVGPGVQAGAQLG